VKDAVSAPPAEASGSLEARAEALYESHRADVQRRTSRLFAWLMIAQWIAGVAMALFLSPYAWSGKVRSIHPHLQVALWLGAAISSLPLFLAFKRPTWWLTRYVISVAQMLWSALLIHLLGGRIETHFHVFGSLTFVAFYRDWRLLMPATAVVAADHFLRGLFWPESVYGVTNPEWWRFLEHAGWVLFLDLFLFLACRDSVREMRLIALRRAEAEHATGKEQEKSAALDRALSDLERSQEALIRTEKLAAIGQLAASVGHELRNPLAAIRNAHTYVVKRLDGAQTAREAVLDPRFGQFMGVIDRELVACSKIVSDLLDFARERPPVLRPCPLRPLVDEALSVVPAAPGVRVVNQVPDGMPIPNLDKEQFRQVLVNLVQNAVEAVPAGRPGQVVVQGEGGGSEPWRIAVSDDGAGILPEALAKIFLPLFTTKTKGTGLGLAIVANLVQRHGGEIRVESELGRGTRFHITLPASQEPRSQVA
jgi:two-component system, NtrC family, sensor histidine kinase HydH